MWWAWAHTSTARAVRFNPSARSGYGTHKSMHLVSHARGGRADGRMTPRIGGQMDRKRR